MVEPEVRTGIGVPHSFAGYYFATSLITKLIGLRPFERILMDKNNSFRNENHENLEVSYLANFWITMIERKELPEQPAGLERGE